MSFKYTRASWVSWGVFGCPGVIRLTVINMVTAGYSCLVFSLQMSHP